MSGKCLWDLTARFLYEINWAGEAAYHCMFTASYVVPVPCSCQCTSGPRLLSPPEGSAAVPTWASQGPWAPMRVTSLAEAFRSGDGLTQHSVEDTQRELQKTQT